MLWNVRKHGKNLWAYDASMDPDYRYWILNTPRPLFTFPQLVEALSILLPRSPVYNTLTSLPLPDATNPTSTTTFEAQSAIHHSLSILEEIIKLLEVHEEEILNKEVEKRRTRLGAASPEQLRKEIGVGIWSGSQVKYSPFLESYIKLVLFSSLHFMMKFWTTPRLRMISAEKLIRNSYDTSSDIFTHYQIQRKRLPQRPMSSKSWIILPAEQ